MLNFNSQDTCLMLDIQHIVGIGTLPWKSLKSSTMQGFSVSLFILLVLLYHGYCKLPIKYSFEKNFFFLFTCIIIDLFLWVSNFPPFVLHKNLELIWYK